VIRGNAGPAGAVGAGGIFAAAALRSQGNLFPSDGNDLQIALFGTRFAANYEGTTTRRDVRARAATGVDLVAGTGNTLEITLSGVVTDAALGAFAFFDSVPTAPANAGDLLTILGSNVAYFYDGFVEPPSGGGALDGAAGRAADSLDGAGVALDDG
jgi:hypothetical protein